MKQVRVSVKSRISGKGALLPFHPPCVVFGAAASEFLHELNMPQVGSSSSASAMSSRDFPGGPDEDKTTEPYNGDKAVFVRVEIGQGFSCLCLSATGSFSPFLILSRTYAWKFMT